MDASVLKGCYLANLAERCVKCACDPEVLCLFLNNSIEKISHFLSRTKMQIAHKNANIQSHFYRAQNANIMNNKGRLLRRGWGKISK
jgi:hypothetical protein